MDDVFRFCPPVQNVTINQVERVYKKRNDGNLRFFISVVVAVVHITQSYSNPTRIRVGLVSLEKEKEK